MTYSTRECPLSLGREDVLLVMRMAGNNRLLLNRKRTLETIIIILAYSQHKTDTQ